MMSPSDLKPSLRIEGTPRFLLLLFCLTAPCLLRFRLNNIPTRLQELGGIQRPAVDNDFVMQVRSRTAPGAAEFTNLVVCPNTLPARHQNAVKMRETGYDSVAVADVDGAAIAFLNAGKYYRAGRGAIHRRAVGRFEIEPGMERLAAVERVVARTKDAADLIVHQRRGEWQRLEQLLQLRLALAVFRRDGGRAVEGDEGSALRRRVGGNRSDAVQKPLDIEARGREQHFHLARHAARAVVAAHLAGAAIVGRQRRRRRIIDQRIRLFVVDRRRHGLRALPAAGLIADRRREDWRRED